MKAPLAVWACPASNTGPRGFSPDALRIGPIRWCSEHIGPRIPQGITHIVIAYPGGQEGPADLRFDMIQRANTHTDPRVSAFGSYLDWAEGAIGLREDTGCKVGFYLGTTKGMTAAQVAEECEWIINGWAGSVGSVDFVVIDTLSDHDPGHLDHYAAYRLEAAGIEVWGEPRPTRGSVMYPRPSICILDKWISSGQEHGDADHTDWQTLTKQGASIVLLDERGSMSASTADAYRTIGIGVCVGLDRAPIVADAGGLQ